MKARLFDEAGQTAAFTVLWLAVLLGMAALVLDVGAWFRESRRLQAVADAAALAGAQAMPQDPSRATALADDYAMRNGGPSPVISFPKEGAIRVRVEKSVPGFFSKVFQIDSVLVGARATAAANSSFSSVRHAAPIVVRHERLACVPGCFDTTLQELRLNNDSTLSGGDFGLADIGRAGSVDVPTLVSWIERGLSSDMPAPEWYDSISSAKFNSNSFEQALQSQAGRPLLFPVYDVTSTTTNPPRYHVVGWVGFVIRSASDVKLTGNCSNQRCYIRGYFVRYIVQGVPSSTASPDWGVKSISLSE